MRHDPSRIFLHGIVPPLVTPLTPTAKFDPLSCARLIQHVIRGGVHGIFVLGSTGEFPSFNTQLRRTVIQETCGMVEKRIPMVVNGSAPCLARSLEVAEYATRSGADAVAICPPFYFSLTQSDLIRYFQNFAQSVS